MPVVELERSPMESHKRSNIRFPSKRMPMIFSKAVDFMIGVIIVMMVGALPRERTSFQGSFWKRRRKDLTLPR